jgi:predicted nucleotidyltransferase component of viral defense system
MLLPKPEDALHLSWMYTLLTAIADDTYLASTLKFKGGTCAAMQEWLDRFSVDLDFELESAESIPKVQQHLSTIFAKKNLIIDDQSKKVPQYFLKYPNKTGKRNTLRIDITYPCQKENTYEKVRFTDIDRILTCQTQSTMAAQKMLCIQDRFARTGGIAGRDIYDLHHFLFEGFEYATSIIEKSSKKKIKPFIKGLIIFLEKKLTQIIIDQDLNTLLPPEKFQKTRKNLKNEILMLLKIELKKW